MKPLAFCLLLLGFAASPLSAATDDEVAARKSAYEVAGAFTNDGFKLRDGAWTGQLDEKKKSHVLQVNLYAGNQYWFSVGTSGGAKKVSLYLFDESGKAMTCEPFAEEGRAAAGFSPAISGSYYLKVEAPDAPASTFCVLYSYK